MSIALRLYNGLCRSYLVPNRVRRIVLGWAGATIPRQSRVSPNVDIRSGELVLGEHTTINVGCILDNRGGLTVGSHVGIGIGVVFTTSSHKMDNPAVRAGAGRIEPITVGDGAWIGTRSVILPGISVGEGAVVAAGAVVTKDVPAHTIVAGVPAKELRALAH